MTFFESLVKPDWIPPDWAFPAAWFTLWSLQFVALLVLSIEPGSPAKRTALILLVTQFIAAVAWQGFVFGPGRLVLSFWWLVGVLALVVATTASAWIVDWKAGALVAPTVLWMAVATTLGWSLMRLNPGA